MNWPPGRQTQPCSRQAGLHPATLPPPPLPRCAEERLLTHTRKIRPVLDSVFPGRKLSQYSGCEVESDDVPAADSIFFHHFWSYRSCRRNCCWSGSRSDLFLGKPDEMKWKQIASRWQLFPISIGLILFSAWSLCKLAVNGSRLRGSGQHITAAHQYVRDCITV